MQLLSDFRGRGKSKDTIGLARKVVNVGIDELIFVKWTDYSSWGGECDKGVHMEV